MTAEMQKQLNDELEKINKLYGSSASSEFPTFNFSGNLFSSSFLKNDLKQLSKKIFILKEPKLDGIHSDKLEAHN